MSTPPPPPSTHQLRSDSATHDAAPASDSVRGISRRLAAIFGAALIAVVVVVVLTSLL